MSPRADFRKRNDVEIAIFKESSKPLTPKQRAIAAAFRKAASDSARKVAAAERARRRKQRLDREALLARAERSEAKRMAEVQKNWPIKRRIRKKRRKKRTGRHK